MSDLTIFTPISYTHAQPSLSEFLLSVADDYFYLGGKRAEVIQGSVERGSQGVVLTDDTIGYVCLALKIASYLILGLPLFFGIVKLTLRSIYSFHVVPPGTPLSISHPIRQQTPNVIPPDSLLEEKSLIRSTSTSTKGSENLITQSLISTSSGTTQRNLFEPTDLQQIEQLENEATNPLELTTQKVDLTASKSMTKGGSQDFEILPKGELSNEPTDLIRLNPTPAIIVASTQRTAPDYASEIAEQMLVNRMLPTDAATVILHPEASGVLNSEGIIVASASYQRQSSN
jgi:hypothetical protein